MISFGNTSYIKEKTVLLVTGLILFWGVDALLGQLGDMIKIGALSMGLTVLIVKSKLSHMRFGKKKSSLVILINLLVFISLTLLTLMFVSDGVEYHTTLNNCRVLDSYYGSGREMIHIYQYHH